ncbi:MAG: DUF4317 domain-containing protein [Lachnospiraceae bacterium]|nr:DUF4317 domain-containing protein [Lachnospiraceae bacterium]
MNRAEINEIKKNLTGDRLSIDRICGCYVDYEKKKKVQFTKAFGQIPEEESFKYFEIFRSTLSGTIGRNLIPLEFPMDQEATGGAQEFLLTLRDTALKEEELVEQFFDRVIENYIEPENYYIVLVHGVYDVPGITKDRIMNDDASDAVYDFILCSICPVKLSKAGLSYIAEEKMIMQRIRDWVVDPPVKGFLFPSFMDRTDDIHHTLYFTKKPDDVQPGLVDALFGAQAPLSAPEQKETFQTIVAETIGEDGDLSVVKNIHEMLSEMVIGNADNPEPLMIGKQEMRQLLEDAGVTPEKMERFDTAYENAVESDDEPLLVTNVSDVKKLSIETPNVVIRVKPDRADLVMPRIIDGRECLIIAVDDHVEVNGINVRTIFKKQA